ncbi:hypothetical protein I5535_12915 [Rhodobacteraceae bacterium F11138]|nr:hypothetical protein [Rhodobacteraceae bacterium F11138]
MLKALLCAALMGGTIAMAQEASPYCESDAAPKPKELCEIIIEAKQANGAGDTDRALALLEEAKNHPATVGKTAAMVLGQKATAHALREETEQSLAALQSALNFTPNDIWLLLRSCQDHAASDYLPKAQRDCARARNLLRRVRNDERQYVLAYVNYSEAQLALAMDQPQIALERLDTIRETTPGKIADRYLDELRASALIAQGNSPAAIDVLSMVLQSNPSMGAAERAGLLYQRGLERLSGKTQAAGITDLREAIELSRQDEAAAMTTAETTKRQIDLFKVERAQQRTAEYAYTLCAVHLRTGKVQAALQDCEALAATQPGQQNHVYLDAWGLAQLEGGRPAAAAQSFASALKKSPRSSIAYGHLNRAVGAAQEQGQALDLNTLVPPEARLFHHGK